MSKRRKPEQPDPSLEAVKRAGETALTALGFGTVFGLWRGVVGASVERTMNDYVLPRLDALVARQRTVRQRIVESKEFAHQVYAIVHRLARTAQEEKRRYLCNGLLRMACEDIEADEATLLLPLVEALSLRHILILEDLLSRCDPPDRYSDSELFRLEAVWERLAPSWPDKDQPQWRFRAIVIDLAGRGLLDPSAIAASSTNPKIRPTVLAKSLLAFIQDPTVPSSE